MTEDEAKVEWMTQELLRYCGPIFIGASLDSCSRKSLSNGTYALLDTGKKHLLVTCAHVWYNYLRARDKDPNAFLGVFLGNGSRPISFKNPEERMIADDKVLDLVTFEFEPDLVPAPHAKAWFQVSQWPIPVPERGESMVTLGFSGSWRQEVPNGCNFGYHILPLTVSEIGGQEILVLRTEDNAEVLDDMKEDWGGMSGSPAYRIDASGKFHLAGFVKLGPEGTKDGSRDPETAPGSFMAGSVRLTRAECLKPDGSLKPPGS